MSIIRVPAQNLLDYEMVVQRLQRNDPGMFLIVGKIIKTWYKDNGVRLSALQDKLGALEKEFFVHDEILDEKGNGTKQFKMRFITPTPLPAIEAQYETKIIRKKTWFRKEVTEPVLVMDAVPERTFPPEPIFNEGKTREEFEKATKAILNAEVEYIY